jgi:hypothetical protein
MATCVKCEEEYTDRRLELGYLTCLECGALDAHRLTSARVKAVLRVMTPNAIEGSVEAVFESDEKKAG